MCGICGIIDLKFQNRVSDFSIIEKMTQKLIHRGPDDFSYYHCTNASLGFTRLSIIGLQNGRQPISNEDGSIILICNGEIFNYIELKEKLIHKGHQFKTDTDVEVILHLYEEYHLDFLNELNGQFAFVLFDSKKQRVLCARDHFGIIPFYFTVKDDFLIFGSEIKAILEFPRLKREVDLVGLEQILSFPGLLSPRTMFRGISSLENGHLLYCNDGQMKDQEYWDLIYPKSDEIEYNTNNEYYIEQLNTLLDESIRLRLRADVPIGSYLSGGLDSSLIVSKATRLSEGGVRKTFSITMENQELDESKYQKMMIKNANLDHYQKFFLSGDILGRLTQAIYHSECPIKETYNTAALALSEAVNKHNLKVILSGEGADELFAGYVGYRFDGLNRKKAISLEERILNKKVWGDGKFTYENQMHALRLSKKELFSQKVINHYDHYDCLNHFIIDKNKMHGRDIIHRRSYIDFKLRLVDHLITDHGDRMAMANGVEVRYPFLDKNLVEFAATIPPYLKLNDSVEKYILREIARDIIPTEISKRSKFGFATPGSPYIINRNNQYINDLLSYENIKKQGYFNPNKVEALKSEYSKEGFYLNPPYDSDFLITVITFGIFLDQFNMPNLT